MELTITINAPELAHAIETLAIAVGCACDKLNAAGLPLGPIIKEAANQVVSEPINVAAPAIPAQMPTSAPMQAPMQQPVATQPYQQTPVQQPMQQAPVQQPAVPAVNVPVIEQSYSMDQLAVAATSLMDAGKRQDIINLLGQFGVQALTALPKEQYGSFATALRGMGASI